MLNQVKRLMKNDFSPRSYRKMPYTGADYKLLTGMDIGIDPLSFTDYPNSIVRNYARSFLNGTELSNPPTKTLTRHKNGSWTVRNCIRPGDCFEYTVDRDGNPIRVMDNRKGSYEYDPNGNMILERSPNGDEYRYEYDMMGNRLRSK